MKTSFLLFSGLLYSASLMAKNIHIESIQSHFTQSITNDQNAVITYKGNMYASQKENKALWEYHAPIIKQIYYQDKKLVIIEPELEQVIFAKLDKIPNILALLKEAKKVGKETYETSFAGLTYTIMMKGEKIEKIQYKDELQNRVVIAFKEEKINQKIDSQIFEYTIPKGYDILEQ